MKYLAVKNFAQFQHYRDRRPPWIKLYQEVLDDYAFTLLSDAARGQLMMIWLIASRTDNKIPNDPAWIARAIQASGPIEMEALLGAGFLEEWEPEKAKGKREEWPSRYVSDETRERVMARCNRRCVTCGAIENLEIDHVIPISKGGTGAEENLQVLCRSCNRKKRAALSAEHDPAQMRSPEGETEGETELERESSSAAREHESVSVEEQAEAELAQRLSNEGERVTLTAMLHAVPNRLAWLMVMRGALDGLDGPQITPQQLVAAMRDWLGNGASAKPNLRQFRGYLNRARKPLTEFRDADHTLSELQRWAKENA